MSLQFCATCGAANLRDQVSCHVCQQPLLLHGRYRVLECVGKGGSGVVYRAQDSYGVGQGERSVAVKHIALSGLTPREVSEATSSLLREAILLSALFHPHLPRIYDCWNDAQHWYLVMDFIVGDTLDNYIDQHFLVSSRRSFLLDEVLDMGLQLCDVLEYLHTRQPPVIFRDLKPANIMRTPGGHLYLIDFGIARRFVPGKRKDTMPLGSPGYAAPEQYGRAQTTPRSDIYSLGILLHQLLMGNDPTDHTLAPTQTFKYKNIRFLELDTLIARMVEMDEARRPGSIREVRRALEKLAARTPFKPKIRPAPFSSQMFSVRSQVL